VKKSFFESDKFAKILAEDVIRVKQRMEDAPSDFHRREFVRTAYSAIEAQFWQLRMYLIEHVIDKKTTSIHEISALKEESYAINDKGEVYIQPKGYSLKVGLRLVFTVLKNHEVPIQMDFGSAEWMNIDSALKIRNRVIHPKSMTDISVSKEEADCCYQAFVHMNNILLNTILGSAFAGINKALTRKNKSSFFSSAKSAQ
jgi:hypothetical protein